MLFLELALLLDKTKDGFNSILENISIWPKSQQIYLSGWLIFKSTVYKNDSIYLCVRVSGLNDTTGNNGLSQTAFPTKSGPKLVKLKVKLFCTNIIENV